MGKTFSTGLLTNGIWQDSSNNIGIGAANSSYKFQVTGTTNLTDALTGTSATFSTGVALSSAGGSNQLTSFVNTSTLHAGSTGLNVFGFNGSNNIYFGKGLTNGGVFLWSNSEVRYYTLPNATGTFALTSDLGSYLPLSGGTLTGALSGTSATFSGNVLIGTTSNITGVLQVKSAGTGTNTNALLVYDSSANGNAFVVSNLNGEARLSASYAGSGINSDMTFYTTTSAGVSTEKLRIASSGAATFSSSVGIGNTATSDRLSVTGTDYNNTAYFIAGSTTGASYGLQVRAGTNSTDYALQISNRANAEMFRVTGSGNVGIGTSSPSALLHLNGANTGYRGQLTIQSTDYAQITFYKGGTTQTDLNASIFSNIGTSEFVIRNNTNAAMIFDTNGTERMRITSGGNVLIGTSTDNGSKLQVNGAITASNLTSGTYTPSVSNTSNVSSTYFSKSAFYTRVGNVVNVYGEIQVTSSSFGSCVFYLSLPITSSTNLLSGFLMNRFGGSQYGAAYSQNVFPTLELNAGCIINDADSFLGTTFEFNFSYTI